MSDEPKRYADNLGMYVDPNGRYVEATGKPLDLTDEYDRLFTENQELLALLAKTREYVDYGLTCSHSLLPDMPENEALLSRIDAALAPAQGGEG